MLRGEHQQEFVWTHEQENPFLAAAEAYGNLRYVAALLIERIRECLTLQWTDVRLEPAEGGQYGYLTVRRRNAKNSKSRNVPPTARVVEVLRRRNPGDGLGSIMPTVDRCIGSGLTSSTRHCGLY